MERNFAVSNPLPVQVAAFLLSVALGGPTAAAEMFQVVRWFNENFGCAFPLKHFLVRPFRFHDVNHTVRPADELQLWESCNMVTLVSRSRGLVHDYQSFVIQAAVSCVRYAHAQRTYPLSVTAGSDMKTFWCARGKSRQQGARPGYEMVRVGLPRCQVGWVVSP